MKQIFLMSMVLFISCTSGQTLREASREVSSHDKQIEPESLRQPSSVRYASITVSIRSHLSQIQLTITPGPEQINLDLRETRRHRRGQVVLQDYPRIIRTLEARTPSRFVGNCQNDEIEISFLGGDGRELNNLRDCSEGTAPETIARVGLLHDLISFTRTEVNPSKSSLKNSNSTKRK